MAYNDELYRLLNVIESQVKDGYTVSLEAYEMQSAYEMAEHLQLLNYPKPRAMQMAQVIAKNPSMAAQMKPMLVANGMSAGTNNNLPAKQGMAAMTGNNDTVIGAAQFDIVITRATTAIAAPLPIAIFASQETANGYRRMLAPYIPQGTVLTSVAIGEADGQPTKARFTYTSGANVDIIDVECRQYPYPSFLDSGMTDFFRASTIRLSLSDETVLSQFNQTFDIKTASMFGRRTEDSIPQIANKGPMQFQDGIIDVGGIFNIDKETGFVYGITENGPDGFNVTASMFIEKFYRQNTIGWR